MSIPVEKFSDSQKEWYARTIAAAVLADDEVNSAEVAFLKPVLTLVKDPAARQDLIQKISQKKAFPVDSPPNLEKETLAAIFTELILIMLCDLDFDRREMAFLEQTAELFRFSDTYLQELMDWATTILEWKKSQFRFVPDAKGELEVPLEDLTAEQKNWYAGLLIATIMLDGEVDAMESNMLKAALSMVEDPVVRKNLAGHIRNRLQPMVEEPPFLDKRVRMLIFLEIVSLLSVDDVISYQEQFYLRDLAKKCGISLETYQEILDWNNSGILWKRSRGKLIERCELLKDDDQGIGSLSSHQNADCNSIIEQYYQCRVCGSKQKVVHFHLKLNSHEEQRNIFGLRIYQKSKPGYDFINYNRVKVTVCPICFFASSDKKMFRKGDGESNSSILEKDDYRKKWFPQSEAIKAELKDIPYDLFTVQRSSSTAVLAYKLAMKSMLLLDKIRSDLEIKWEMIGLMLALAQVLAESGKRAAGDKFLNKAAAMASTIFNDTENRLQVIPIQCARFLFMFSMYKGDISLTDEYMDFFSQILTDKINEFEPDDVPMINRIVSDVKKAYFKRENYLRKNLDGYELKAPAPEKKKQDKQQTNA